jgi:hypothetical protein
VRPTIRKTILPHILRLLSDLFVGDLLFSLAHHANISPVSIRAPRALLIPLLRERILTHSRRASSYLPARVPNPPMIASNVSCCQRPVKMRIKVDLSWMTSAKDFRSETRSSTPPPLLLSDVIAACALPLRTIVSANFNSWYGSLYCESHAWTELSNLC